MRITKWDIVFLLPWPCVINRAHIERGKITTFFFNVYENEVRSANMSIISIYTHVMLINYDKNVGMFPQILTIPGAPTVLYRSLHLVRRWALNGIEMSISGKKRNR